MARKKVTIKWINKGGISRVAFLDDGKIYILIRKPELSIDKKILDVKYNESYTCFDIKAREIWQKLIDADFREINVDKP